MSAPVASDGARPARRASAASGIAASAAPTVVPVAAMPDSASDPETCVTSSAPAESVRAHADPGERLPGDQDDVAAAARGPDVGRR